MTKTVHKTPPGGGGGRGGWVVGYGWRYRMVGSRVGSRVVGF